MKRPGIHARLYADSITHDKVAPLSDRAWRLWASSLAWSRERLTDGHIPTTTTAILLPYATPAQRIKAARELEDMGRWHPNGNGWHIHDYAECQETRAEVEALSEARSKAGRLGAEVKWRDSNEATP